MDTQTQVKGLLSDVELELPLIVSRVKAVSEALGLAHASGGDLGDEVQFHRGLHWILNDTVEEFKDICKRISEGTSLAFKS